MTLKDRKGTALQIAAVICLAISLKAEAEAGAVAIQSIGETAAESRVFVDPDGVLLPEFSGYLAVGTMRLDDAEIVAAASANDFGSILSSFKQFGNAGGINDLAGFASRDASLPLFEGDGFVGNEIYAILGNSAVEGAAPETATSWFIYKADRIFEADDPVFEHVIDLTSPEVDNILVGSLGCDVYHPTLNLFVPSINLGPQFPSTAHCIPEPSVSALLLIAAFSLSHLRRRKMP